MPTPDMTAMLQKRRQELIKELQAIDVLLAAAQPASKNDPSKAQPQAPYSGRLGFLSSRDEHIAMLGEKTDAISWKNYIHKAIQILGPSRSTAISELVIDTNDRKIPDSRVKDAVTNALTALVKEKKVSVKKDEEKAKVYYLGEALS